MSKVININTYRKRKIHSGQMDYEATAAVKDKFEIAAGIIDELFLCAEDRIRECGFEPSAFRLDKESAKGCLYADLNEFFAGGEETLSLTYEAVIGGVRYAVVSTFVKWNGEEWLEYADGNWAQGPGPDFV